MAGKPGRSGRRTKYEEVHINTLAGLSVRWAEENWKKLGKEMRLRILLALGPKYVVQKLEQLGSKETSIIIIKSNGEKIESEDHIKTSARALPTE